jgi:hypothetical protein
MPVWEVLDYAVHTFRFRFFVSRILLVLVNIYEFCVLLP